MKNLLRFGLPFLTIALAGSVLAGGMPTMDVTVSDAGGKLAYKGKTSADGSFSTATLPQGQYTVQFKSRNSVDGSYALVIAAGKQKVVSEAVPGLKFSQGGVAMAVKVGQGLNITGQMTSGATARNINANAKVKVVDGKRFVWQGPETGSHMGGRWVEEGTPSRVIQAGASALQSTQNGGLSGR